MTTPDSPESSRPSTIVIGSWPGYEETHNAFITNFLDGLVQAGARVVSVPRISRSKSLDCDVLLLHWIDRVFWDAKTTAKLIRDMAQFHATLLRLRRRTKIVWVIHNLEPHDLYVRRRVLWRLFAKAMPRLIDGALTLSPGTIRVAVEAFPGLRRKPISSFQHPSYFVGAGQEQDRIDLRARLGLQTNCRVIAYVGMIRPYKGIDELIEVFRGTTDPSLRLLLAGKVKGYTMTDLATKIGDDPRILTNFGNLTYDAFNATLACSDLFAAPLTQYLHSGSLVHALSAERPVLTPRTPYSESLAAEVGTEWVRLYEGSLNADRLLSEVLRPHPVTQPNLAAFAPAAVGRQVIDFLHQMDLPIRTP